MDTLVATFIAGIAFIIAVAVVVALIDARQTATWRRIAAERRRAWEDFQLVGERVD